MAIEVILDKKTELLHSEVPGPLGQRRDLCLRDDRLASWLFAAVERRAWKCHGDNRRSFWNGLWSRSAPIRSLCGWAITVVNLVRGISGRVVRFCCHYPSKLGVENTPGRKVSKRNISVDCSTNTNAHKHTFLGRTVSDENGLPVVTSFPNNLHVPIDHFFVFVFFRCSLLLLLVFLYLSF